MKTRNEEMPTLGKALEAARLRMKLTASQAAAATRIKIQQIEALERDDFSGIAAPTYGRGFIKIYAEAVGLDPEPLVREYMEKAGGRKPSLTPDLDVILSAPMPAPVAPVETPTGEAPDSAPAPLPPRSPMRFSWPRLKLPVRYLRRPSYWIGALAVLAILAVAWLLTSTPPPKPSAAPMPAAIPAVVKKAPPTPAPPMKQQAVIEEPPAPYLDYKEPRR